MKKLLFAVWLYGTTAWPQATPDWLRNAEMVTSYDRAGKTIDAKRLRGIPLLINVQDKQGIDDAHRKGFRVITYTSCMDTFIDQRGVEGRSGRMPFRPDTANALLVDKDGRFVDTLMDGTYRLHRKLICTNSKTYVEKMTEFLKETMDLGGDGLFVDNVSESRQECYGDGLKIGWSSRYNTVLAQAKNSKFLDPRLTDVPVHTHLYPDKPHSYAFRQMLMHIRTMVKGYGPDKIMVINGGPVYADTADATMIESYICSWAWKGRRQSWQELKAGRARYADYLKSGGAVIALTYLGQTATSVKDDAFFSFAAARLSDYIWSDYRTAGVDASTVLYDTHLGPAEGALQTAEENVDYRWYRDGVIVMNGTDRAADLKLPAGGRRALVDLYAGSEIQPSGSTFALAIPAQSGRVYKVR